MNWAVEGTTLTREDKEKARHIIDHLHATTLDGYATKRQMARLAAIFQPIFEEDWRRFLFWVTRHTEETMPKIWAARLIRWSDVSSFSSQIEYVKALYYEIAAN